MPKVAVVTDSTACIPSDMVKKYNIRVAPLSLIWNKDEQFQDNVDMLPGEFYRRMRRMKPEEKLPTTSSAIQGEFLKIFQDLKGKVDGVVTIVLTGALGACYTSAMSARNMIKDFQIEVIDSHTSQCALGFAVVAAAEAARNGSNIEDIARIAREVSGRAYCYWTMETLEYMRRGGRVPTGPGDGNGVIEIKPIMALKRDGTVGPVGGARDIPEAMGKMAGLLKENITNTRLHAGIVHSDCPEAAREFQNILISSFHPCEVWISELTPAIGVHFGPGTIGVSFYNE